MALISAYSFTAVCSQPTNDNMPSGYYHSVMCYQCDATAAFAFALIF